MTKPDAFSECNRFINGHGRRNPKTAMLDAIATLKDQEACDIYGAGSLIESFEEEIATLLGKEAAVFMPSGTMAQQIALRIWCDKRGNNSIAMHPTSHLEIHEQAAYQKLHSLSSQLIGDASQLFGCSDLEALKLPLAAILWELPQREIGGQLPEWSELNRQITWAKESGIACHLDGARLWEAAPYYQRSLSEIAALFESVYVSFYKGLGGIAGAVLAGDSEFIAEAKIWQRRHGGNLISLYPYVLSARAGLAKHRDNFAGYRDRAQSLAKSLNSLEGIEVVPECPPTNMMHLHIAGDTDALNQANREIAEKHQLQLFSRAREIIPGLSLVELSIGQACESISDQEAKSLFTELLASMGS